MLMTSETPAPTARKINAWTALRDAEFARLDASGQVYLDYTGSALYPESLVRRHADRLSSDVMGNPHSESAPSLASTSYIEEARRRTLRLLDANPADYDVVFTANASGAMRVLAEAFPFTRDSRLVLTADNHNSVNGLRVAARERRARLAYVPLDRQMRARDPRALLTKVSQPSLFAFPAQSNFSGVRHPLDWVRTAQRRGYRVLLDAAAFAPSAALSLTQTPADFVALSFYKLFGYPTGVGALVARRDALALLRRRYFGGGTVQFVSIQNGMARAKRGPEAFEDGTPNFLAMPAVCDGLEWLHQVGMDRIATQSRRMTAALLERLAAFGNSVEIYGPESTGDRGGTVAFNLRRRGTLLAYESIEAEARARGIAVRGGCFCNPGAAEHAFTIPATRARACLQREFSIPRFRECLGDRAVGALRASIGIPTTIGDLDRLASCIEELTT
jgi:selenocysteine lyase/cysteine desulfurase